MTNPLQQKCQAAGFDYNKLPVGASDIKSNNDGTFTITVNGQQTKYSANGSVFSGNASYTVVNGSHSLDPLQMMMSSAGFDASTQIAGNMPYGMGSVWGQGGVASSLQSYGDSMGFNFDFSQVGASVAGPGQAVEEIMQNAPKGDTEIEDSAGNKTTVKKMAKELGYGTTSRDGVFVKKDADGKMVYYKWDKETEDFVECNANGTTITDEQRMIQEEQEAKEKEAAEKAKKQKEARAAASGLAGNMYSSMKGAGTDDSKLHSTVNQMNKDNVLEVLEVYQDNYSANMGGETLIQSIQDDMSGRDEAKVINKIADALIERARELGLDEEASALRATLDAEFKPKASWTAVGRSILNTLNPFKLFGIVDNVKDGYHAIKGTADAAYANDDVVNSAIMKLANQIKAKEAGEEYVEPQPAAEE